MTVEVTLSGVATVAGNTPETATDEPQVRARTRARAKSVTDSTEAGEGSASTAPGRVSAAVRSAVSTVGSDVARAWVWGAAPPSLRDLVKEDLGPTVPAGHAGLRRVAVVWRRVVAIPTSTVLYLIAWVLQDPLRTIVAAVVVGLILINL